MGMFSQDISHNVIGLEIGCLGKAFESPFASILLIFDVMVICERNGYIS
jgi:hypothetical protein